MSKSNSPHILAAHTVWRSHLSPSDIVVDMTCGNGRDTHFLAQCVPQGRVFGFDIQQSAIEKTRALTASCSNVELIHASHESIDSVPFPSPPRLIVYNLGYLPGGDKSIVTQTESTLKSVERSMQILAPNGAISITCYPGHDEGAKEETALIQLLSSLDSHQWTVYHQKWINRPKSPTLIWISILLV